jgi:hypothetical protein
LPSIDLGLCYAVDLPRSFAARPSRVSWPASCDEK